MGRAIGTQGYRADQSYVGPEWFRMYIKCIHECQEQEFGSNSIGFLNFEFLYRSRVKGGRMVQHLFVCKPSLLFYSEIYAFNTFDEGL
jgi:hypothetical protein